MEVGPPAGLAVLYRSPGALEIERGRSFLTAGGPLFLHLLLAQRLLEVQKQVVVELERTLRELRVTLDEHGLRRAAEPGCHLGLAGVELHGSECLSVSAASLAARGSSGSVTA